MFNSIKSYHRLFIKNLTLIVLSLIISACTFTQVIVRKQLYQGAIRPISETARFISYGCGLSPPVNVKYNDPSKFGDYIKTEHPQYNIFRTNTTEGWFPFEYTSLISMDDEVIENNKIHKFYTKKCVFDILPGNHHIKLTANTNIRVVSDLMGEYYYQNNDELPPVNFQAKPGIIYCPVVRYHVKSINHTMPGWFERPKSTASIEYYPEVVTCDFEYKNDPQFKYIFEN